MKLEGKILKNKIVVFIFLSFILAFACVNKKASNRFEPKAQDTISLMQTLLNNKNLNDSLFSIQNSQKLIIHKDNRIPINAKFEYKGNPVVIQEEKFGRKYSDYNNPRFLIAFADCIIKKDSAELSFEMPDVGLGIATYWERSKSSNPWALLRWEKEYY